MEQLHQQRENHETGQYYQSRIVFYPRFQFRGHERKILFNSLGMPTSTTVSMVFELLGATFVVALIKMAGGIGLGFDDLLNTEKALSVILGIFL